MPLYNPGHSFTQDLRSLSEKELDAEYKKGLTLQETHMPSDQMSAFIIEFLRRDAERTNRVIRRLTWAITAMTLIMTIMTGFIMWATMFPK